MHAAVLALRCACVSSPVLAPLLSENGGGLAGLWQTGHFTILDSFTYAGLDPEPWVSARNRGFYDPWGGPPGHPLERLVREVFPGPNRATTAAWQRIAEEFRSGGPVVRRLL